MSIVIPALDESSELPATVDALARLVPAPHEVIIADASSPAFSIESTRPLVRTLHSERGRGIQMNHGARSATGDALLFLHADARLPPASLQLVSNALQNNVGGAFTIRFRRRAGSPKSMPLVALGINARTVLTRTATGDQAIFCRRSDFDGIGGYKPWPLFEDCDLVERLKTRGSFTILRSPVEISDRRYARFGPWRTTALMWWLRFRYWRGVSPSELKRAFIDVR